jgi:glucokinase
VKNMAVVSMDIGGTNIRMAVVAKDGGIIARSKSSCRIAEGRISFLEAIKNQYKQLRQIALESDHEIVAVGAGVPGLINRTGTVISSVNLKPIEGFNLQQWLESLSGLPVVVMNDANAAAVAEMSYGAGRPFTSLLHVTLGTGVGSGLILDGKLWTGVDGVASEFGHVTVEPNGKPCQCGNHGCLEQYASATAILRFAQEKISGGAESALARMQYEILETADVADAAYNGDSLALECFSRAGSYLGIACASAVNMLNLEAIIVGGGVSESFDLFAPAIRREIDARAFHLPSARLKLLKGELGDNAGIMGAAAAAFSVPASA